MKKNRTLQCHQLDLRSDPINNEPLLSIVIPTYNSAKFISDLLNSINAYCPSIQTEIVLIDDGSTDSTLDEVRNINLRDNISLVIVSQDHHGASCARNKGILKAKGYYIMFCDSDDVLISNFSKYVMYGIKHSADILSFSLHVENTVDKVDTDELDDLMVSMLLGKSGRFVPNEFTVGPYCKLIRRKFLIDNNILFFDDLRWFEDLLFNLFCLSKAKSVILARDKIYSRRVNKNSLSHNVDDSCIETAREVLTQSKMILVKRKQYNRVIDQEQLYLVLSLLGSFFIYHPQENLYDDFISHIKFKNTPIKLGSSLHSKIIIWSLGHLGFSNTILWYRTVYKLKHSLEG